MTPAGTVGRHRRLCRARLHSAADADRETANQRAQRYCSSREKTARLEQIRHNGDSSLQVYRCIASE